MSAHSPAEVVTRKYCKGNMYKHFDLAIPRRKPPPPTRYMSCSPLPDPGYIRCDATIWLPDNILMLPFDREWIIDAVCTDGVSLWKYLWWIFEKAASCNATIERCKYLTAPEPPRVTWFFDDILKGIGGMHNPRFSWEHEFDTLLVTDYSTRISAKVNEYG